MRPALFLLFSWVLQIADSAVAKTPLPVEKLLDAIAATDIRLARIGSSLAQANVAFCARRQPDVGIVFHALDSYAADARDNLRTRYGIDANIVVEGVLPAGAAADADIQSGDAVVAINDMQLPKSAEGVATSAAIVAFHARLAELPSDQPIRFDFRRRGAEYKIAITPKPACRSRFELRIGSTYDASADGEMVQIGSRFLADLDDGDLAVLVAHELAHNILQHPQRLREVGAKGGIVAGLGRNVAYFRQTEIEADILSVSLMANAGYSSENVANFWRSAGRRIFGSVFADRSHPSWQDRAATTEAEAVRIRATAQRPYIPNVIISQDKPLDGNWRAILVRAPN